MQSAVVNALENANTGDLVVIYFAGHGMKGIGIHPNGRIEIPLDEQMTNRERLADVPQHQINAELSRYAWFPRDVVVNQDRSSASGTLNAHQLMVAIEASKADVIVVSGTMGFDLPLPSLKPTVRSANPRTQRSDSWDSSIQKDRAVLFVGPEFTADSNYGSQLQLLISRLLTGAADTGLRQHEPLIGRFLGFSEDKTVGLAEKVDPLVTKARSKSSGISDGFVSLREFVETLSYYHERAETYFGCDLRVRGYLPTKDRILTQVNQPPE